MGKTSLVLDLVDVHEHDSFKVENNSLELTRIFRIYLLTQ